MSDLKIVLLGKTGDGKSSTGNTILNKNAFHTANSPNSITHKCESKTEFINGRKITVVDGPGFLDASLPEEKFNREIVRCITECAPGPHAFLIVLKQGRYIEQEKEVVKKITDSFGDEALRYAVVLFTHGDQLSENQTIQDFVAESAELQELVKKCGGRVHAIDNKYWKQQQDGYRSNRVQVEDLLNTIEEMVRVNGGQCYTNEMLQMVQQEIEEEMKKTGNEGSERDRTVRARQSVFKILVRLVGLGTGTLLGALLGAASAVMLFVSQRKVLSATIPVEDEAAQAANLLGATSEAVEFKAAVGVVAASAAVGGVAGGIIGYDAAEGAETMTEAMKQAASATYDGAKDVGQKVKKNL